MKYIAKKPEVVQQQMVKIIVNIECEMTLTSFLGVRCETYLSDDNELHAKLAEVAKSEGIEVYDFLGECDFWTGDYTYDISLVK